MLGGELGGPDPGQGAPGRGDALDFGSRQEEGLLQDSAAQTHILRLFHGNSPGCHGFFPLPDNFAGGSQPLLSTGQRGNSAVGRTKRRSYSFGGFFGKQLHLQLLHGIQLCVTFQVQLHRFIASFI